MSINILQIFSIALLSVYTLSYNNVGGMMHLYNNINLTRIFVPAYVT